MTSELILATVTSITTLLAAGWMLRDRSELNVEAELIRVPVKTDET